MDGMEGVIVFVSGLLMWGAMAGFELYIAGAFWASRERQEPPLDPSTCALVTIVVALLVVLQSVLVVPWIWRTAFLDGPALTMTPWWRLVFILLLLLLGLLGRFAAQILGWRDPDTWLVHLPLGAKLVLWLPIAAGFVIYAGYKLLTGGL